MHVEVEIYIKKFKSYFEKNPKSREELFSTYPGVTFDDFMVEVEYVIKDNFTKINDPTVTRKQILDILNELYLIYVEENHKELGLEVGVINYDFKIFQETPYGVIGLN
jgi:hypothetical protein